MDSTEKRRNIANGAIVAATQLTDALKSLIELSDERAKLIDPFADEDFNFPGLKHLTTGMVGSLFDFVTTSFSATFDDTANSGRNEQILLQVRK